MDRFVSLAAAIISIDVRMLARSTRRNMVVTLLLFLLFTSTYVSGVSAVAIYLASIFGALGAALTIAIASLAMALFVLAYALLMNRVEQRRYHDNKQAAEELLRGVVEVVPTMVDKKPISSLAVAAVLAFVLTRSFPRK